MTSGDSMISNGDYDFNLEKQQAAQRMRELNMRSKYRQSSCGTENRRGCTPESERLTAGEGPDRARDISGGFNIPPLGEIGIDSDMALILGLVMILSAEKSDRLLLLALLYILI